MDSGDMVMYQNLHTCVRIICSGNTWMFDHLEWGQTPNPRLIFLVVLSARPRRKAGVPALTVFCEEGPPDRKEHMPASV